MPAATLAFAVAFIVLGLVGYFVTGRASVTALIPAFLGLVVLLLGLMARNPRRARMAVLMALMVVLLGVGGSFRGLRQIGDLVSGRPVARPAAVVAQTLMAALGAVYALLAARFLARRRA